jgi:hypothetical protein
MSGVRCLPIIFSVSENKLFPFFPNIRWLWLSGTPLLADIFAAELVFFKIISNLKSFQILVYYTTLRIRNLQKMD